MNFVPEYEWNYGVTSASVGEIKAVTHVVLPPSPDPGLHPREPHGLPVDGLAAAMAAAVIVYRIRKALRHELGLLPPRFIS